MPEPDKAAIVAREWIGKADNDLKTAAQTLKLGADCPTDTVCFHAQQCVEKCLKAGQRRVGSNVYRAILPASNWFVPSPSCLRHFIASAREI